jgi:hypothetical protein
MKFMYFDFKQMGFLFGQIYLDIRFPREQV